jgi:NADH dehydrogenase
MILVTGGTGFVGGHVVRALRSSGKDVRCLARTRARAGELEALGCEIAEGDVTDRASLARATTGCEAVIHLVAIIAGSRVDFERVMVAGTRNVVDAAGEAGVRRFVLMSALGVSEATKDLVPYYGAKWEMEQTVAASGLKQVIFRPSFVLGRDGGVLPTFADLVRRLPVTPVVGPGTNRLQPIWVDDVAAYFADAVELDAPTGAYELGGPEAVTWDEFWQRLASALHRRRRLVHIPFGVMRAQARLLELLPKPPVTRDQVKMLAAGDNVCDIEPARTAFHIDPIGLDEQLLRGAA